MAEFDGQLRHRGIRAVQRMVEFAPSTGGLALWVQHTDLPAPTEANAPALPAVSTDGLRLFYGAAFTDLPLAQQTGLVAHEVLHIALRHPQRFLDLQRLLGDVDLQLFNICADAIVNSALGHLAWLELPAWSARLERLLSAALSIEQPVEAALLEWDVERLYRALDDRRPPQAGRAREDGPRASRARTLGARDACDLLPDATAQGAPEQQAAQTREWHERIVRAHAGDGLHSMLRALIADLPRTRTPWEQVLRTQLTRGLMARPAQSWSRPSRSYIANQGRAGPTRRMPWEPGFSGMKSVPRLALMIDVSGSIDDVLMQRFTREIEAITRRLEAAVVLVIGDETVHRVVSFEPGRTQLGQIAFNGGGGTDFTPLLEEADRHRPDIGVFLTDLQGPARFVPRWPLWWAVPEAFARSAPSFGRMMVLD